MPHWYGIVTGGTDPDWQDLAGDPKAWRDRTIEVIESNDGDFVGIWRMQPDPDEGGGHVDDTPSKLVIAIFDTQGQAKRALKGGLRARKYGLLLTPREETSGYSEA
jgi:hypothetical protein